MKLPKFLGKIIGVLLVLSFLLPIPAGTLRLALGLSILVCASLPFALGVQAGRRKFGWLNRLMTWIENKIGEKWAGNLILTRPENDPRTHFAGNKKSTDTQQKDRHSQERNP